MCSLFQFILLCSGFLTGNRLLRQPQPECHLQSGQSLETSGFRSSGSGGQRVAVRLGFRLGRPGKLCLRVARIGSGDGAGGAGSGLPVECLLFQPDLRIFHGGRISTVDFVVQTGLLSFGNVSHLNLNSFEQIDLV